MILFTKYCQYQIYLCIDKEMHGCYLQKEFDAYFVNTCTNEGSAHVRGKSAYQYDDIVCLQSKLHIRHNVVYGKY